MKETGTAKENRVFQQFGVRGDISRYIKNELRLRYSLFLVLRLDVKNKSLFLVFLQGSSLNICSRKGTENAL